MNQQSKISKSVNTKFTFFIWLIYGVITFFAVINHEPNRDEAQVWLIARDLNITSIYYELSAMGHPGLWYFILFPFAKLGFPFATMLIIHWMIGITSAALLLFKSKINIGLKVLFLFSYYMLFEYMVPARNYSLTILLLFLIATYYESRFTNPIRYALIIFALFNANTHSFGAAFGLFIIYLIDGYKTKQLPKSKFGIAIMLLGIGAIIFQLWPSLNEVSRNVTMHSSLIPQFNFENFWVSVTAIQNAFIPVLSEYEELKIALFFTSVFILYLITLVKKTSIFIFMLTSSTWLFYLFSTKLSGSWRHEGLLIIFVIFSIWITSNYERKENEASSKFSNLLDLQSLELFFTTFLKICFVITIVFGFKTINKEYKYSYSGAEEAANFINKNYYSEIACYPSYRATAIAPYISNTKIWQIERNSYGTYYALDSTFYKLGNSLTEEEIVNRTKEKYKNNYILVVNKKLNSAEDSIVKAVLLFENKKFIWACDDEHYFIYSMNFKKELSN